MQVKRDFDELYAAERDPWQIGDADSPRYDLYHDLILARTSERGNILDIGCGFGAFLARFRGEFDELSGIELSAEAVAKGQQRFPDIRFLQGSAADLEAALPGDERFDVILYSDVIYYLDEQAKRRSLRWIRDRLRAGGLAFVAGWCPGKDWLYPDELRRLVERYLVVEHERLLDSEHALFFARRAERLAAVTIDYETWQPIPQGESIDWEETVFRPARTLMQIGDETGVPITFMAEMGEYFWLKENEPRIAARMGEQWQEALGRGHDVQLHLHPSWLPELGARREGDDWSWDFRKAKAADYPGDLSALIGRCCEELQQLLRQQQAGYRVTCFRAGTYQAQPFDRLHAALASNGITCDSSVFAGGYSGGRGYDFRLAYSRHAPYFANRFDPQLKAPPSESDIVELPIFTYEPGERWFLDGSEGPRLAERLLHYLEQREEGSPSTESYRRRRKLLARLLDFYGRRPRWRSLLNRVMPRSLAHDLVGYPPERLVPSDYFVMIGHTKGPHDFDAVRSGFRRLKLEAGLHFVGLGEMAQRARAELIGGVRGSTEEAIYQVAREHSAVLGEDRNAAQSFHLQEMIPWDRDRVLDLGCGAGYWSERIAELFPWMRLLGLDYGEDFIRKARRLGGERTAFAVASFDDLPVGSASFDCVYADNTLEHAFDVDRALGEVHRILADGGVLVAALPSDARNPSRICDNHNWKTAPHEVRKRLEAAGFTRIELDEIDTYRELGMSPYPPADDRMIYLRAWKEQPADGRWRRALQAMDWSYRRLDPTRSSEGQDALRILRGGHAWCWGYCVALGKLLKREGYTVRWVTMIAEDHPRGRGEKREDSHEVLALEIDGRERILDPTSNSAIEYPLEQVLEEPQLAQGPTTPDARWRERGYHLYSTAAWYSRVTRFMIREDPDRPGSWIPRKRS